LLIINGFYAKIINIIQLDILGRVKSPNMAVNRHKTKTDTLQGIGFCKKCKIFIAEKISILAI